MAKIPRDSWVLVADGGRALLLHNAGDATLPNLRTVKHLDAPPNPRTSAQGADRPGKVAAGDRRSAVAQTDWHDEAETAFATTVCRELLADFTGKSLIIVAPPRFLAALRRALPRNAADAVHAEIAKDLTHLPIVEIEKHLLAEAD